MTSDHYSFTQIYSGYHFTHWTRNGERVTDGSGYSRNRAMFLLQEDTDLVAHFVMSGDDMDGDTIPDYLEFRLAGELDELAPEVDADGDGLTFAAERRLGLSPLSRDSIRDGGISSRLSAPVALQFSVPPLALAPERLQTVAGSPAGARVGVLAVSPSLPGRTYQFALELGMGGDDNGRFVIAGNELRLASALNVTGGILRVRIRATDDLGVSRSWPATVAVVDSLIAPLEFRTVAEGSPLEVMPVIGVIGMSDEVPAIVVVSAPSGSSFDAASGLWSWTPDEADGPGVFAVTLRADNGVITSERTFQVTVTEVNRPPTIELVPLQILEIGEPWALQLVASDPDFPVNTLTFALGNAPSGATIDASSGLVTWTPGSEHAGSTMVINASVSDGPAMTTISVELRVAGTSGGGYESWAQSTFTAAQMSDPAISGPDADPEKDGISNLLEWAFNLDPLVSDTMALTSGTGIRGLPSITSQKVANQMRLRIEYVRRKSAAAAYSVEFSSDPGASSWTTFTGSEVVSSIDSIWERVVVEDSLAGEAKRFSRVKITNP